MCRSTSLIKELKYFFKSGTQGVLLRVGSPCDNYLGYCDHFHKCRKIDENGPLGRLFKIFSKENAESVKDWITVSSCSIRVLYLQYVLCTYPYYIRYVHVPSSIQKITTVQYLGSLCNTHINVLFMHVCSITGGFCC